MTVPFLTAPLGPRHGFFTRQGGLSAGGYASLNLSLSGGDDRDTVLRNRALAARALGAEPALLVGTHQVHGVDVAIVDAPWAPGAGPRADGMATARKGIALCVITADCGPVLLADAQAGIVGACHAGWRGAAAGIIEATVAAMVGLGADPARIVAALGPCIHQPSYQVGADLRDAVLAAEPGAGDLFADDTPGRWRFDLPGLIARRLRRAVGQVHVLAHDTAAEPDRFFSHRRRTLSGGGPIGHQASIIVA
jgi:hypothetical protein